MSLQRSFWSNCAGMLLLLVFMTSDLAALPTSPLEHLSLERPTPMFSSSVTLIPLQCVRIALYQNKENLILDIISLNTDELASILGVWICLDAKVPAKLFVTCPCSSRWILRLIKVSEWVLQTDSPQIPSVPSNSSTGPIFFGLQPLHPRHPPTTEVQVFDFSLSSEDMAKLDALTTAEVVQEAQGDRNIW